MKKFIVMLMAFVVSGCTDASLANFGQLGEEARVQCFSGGEVVYEGTSTGKIQSNASEDGLYFMEKESGKFVRLYADCIVRTL